MRQDYAAILAWLAMASANGMKIEARGEKETKWRPCTLSQASFNLTGLTCPFEFRVVGMHAVDLPQ